MFDEDNIDQFFDVLQGRADVEDEFDDIPDAVDSADDHLTQKRSADHVDEANDEELAAEVKRVRTDQAEQQHQPAPLVADSFEQETSREVANIAGLQGAPDMEGEQITLSHQVCHENAGRVFGTHSEPGSPPSRCTRQLRLCAHFKACAARETRTRVQLHPRSFPARRRVVD